MTLKIIPKDELKKLKRENLTDDEKIKMINIQLLDDYLKCGDDMFGFYLDITIQDDNCAAMLRDAGYFVDEFYHVTLEEEDLS